MAKYPTMKFPPGWLVKANVVKHPYIPKELYDQGVKDWRQAPGQQGQYGMDWYWVMQIVEHPEFQPGTEVALYAKQNMHMRLCQLNPQVGQTVCFRKGTEDGNKSPINVSLLGGEPQGQQMPPPMQPQAMVGQHAPQQGYQPPPQAPPAYLPPPPPSQQPAAAPPQNATRGKVSFADILAARRSAMLHEAQTFKECGTEPSAEALTSAANAVAIQWRENGYPMIQHLQPLQPQNQQQAMAQHAPQHEDYSQDPEDDIPFE